MGCCAAAEHRYLSALLGSPFGTQIPFAGGVDRRRDIGLVDACYAVRQPLRRLWSYAEACSTVREATK